MGLQPEGATEIVLPRSAGNPLVSVVLPTYNRAALLARSVDSVLQQTEPNLELLVVDDGSQDATGQLVAQYQARDARVGYLREQNLGLPKALNNGFRVARGTFLTWTSDDNRYFPEALERLSRYLIEHPEVGLVYADMILRRNAGLVFAPPRHRQSLWRNNPFGGAFLYRRDVAQKVGEYDAELRMVEDYDYLLRLSYQAPVAHWPYVVYEYGEHEDSLTSTRQLEHLKALDHLLQKHRRLGRTSNRNLSDLAVLISGVNRRRGYAGNALRLALVAWRLRPLNWRPYGSALLALAGWPWQFRPRLPAGSDLTSPGPAGEKS